MKFLWLSESVEGSRVETDGKTDGQTDVLSATLNAASYREGCIICNLVLGRQPESVAKQHCLDYRDD